ncbi:MAG: FtsX-like permease family protein [Planctomycetota bacterium]
MYKFILTLRYLQMRFLFTLSVLGVATGVMVLMITISVMSGFLVEVQKLIRGIHADLDYLPKTRGFLDFAQLKDKLMKADSRVVAISPQLQREILICTEQERWSGGIMIGIDYPSEIQTTQLQNFIYTPYKQIWEELRTLTRESPVYSWTAIGFQRESHQKYLYIQSKRSLPDGQIKTAFHRLQFNDADLVSDYTLDIALPEKMDLVPEGFSKWITQQNHYLQEKQIEFVMKAFREDVTLGGQGINLLNPFEQKDLSLLPPVIIGESLLKELQLSVGQIHTITLMSAQQIRVTDEKTKEEKDGVQEYNEKFRIVGVFKSGLYEIDSKYIYADIKDMQKFLYQLPYQYTSAFIKINSQTDEEMESVVQKLNTLPETFFITTWKERKRNLLRVVSLQKNVISIILFFIILMASTTILFILLQLAFERKQDIGILKSMGASAFGISSIFCFYGLIIGIFGIVFGLIGGYSIVTHVNEISRFIYEHFGKEIFPRNIYHLNEIPTKIQIWDILLITLPTVFVSVLFSLPAAYLAARQNPVETLQSK